MCNSFSERLLIPNGNSDIYLNPMNANTRKTQYSIKMHVQLPESLIELQNTYLESIHFPLFLSFISLFSSYVANPRRPSSSPCPIMAISYCVKDGAPVHSWSSIDVSLACFVFLPSLRGALRASFPLVASSCHTHESPQFAPDNCVK